MSFLTKVGKRLGVRFLSSVARQYLQAEKLSERTLIRLSGKEVVPLLQGLITNDMEHVQHGTPAMYSMFLNKGGRVLYDSIIYRSPHKDTFFIECDKNVDRELAQHLKLFRVRRKISVDTVGSEYVVWAVYDGGNSEMNKYHAPSTRDVIKNKSVIIAQDPRIALLGTRLIVPHDYNIFDINKFFPDNELRPAENATDYTTLRYRLGIGEGIVDHLPTKSFPMETNCDYLHGISFHKGCYLGQELTARTYHTGVIRKRLMPIVVPDNAIAVDPNANVQTLNGTNVGKMRGHKNGRGVALMRIEQALEAPALLLNGVVCTVEKPFWWPGVLPTRDAILAEKQTTHGRTTTTAENIPPIPAA